MPRRKLGQHFLRDLSIARRIVEAVDIRDGDVIVEVGPGRGALTDHIAEQIEGTNTVALLIEIDPELVHLLGERYRGRADVEIICADARDLDLASIPEMNSRFGYKVVANLPYYAGTPIVRHFIEHDQAPSELVVMLQREVARDMCANPGDMSLLSLAVQIYSEPRRLFDVGPEAFRPRPEVTSRVVKLKTLANPLVEEGDVDDLFRIAKWCFRGRRKQLHNSLANGMGVSANEAKEIVAGADIDSTRRPATLSIDEWKALLAMWRERGGLMVTNEC